MKKETLFESFNYLDEDLLERSETVRTWSFSTFLKPVTLVAVSVLLVFFVSTGMNKMGGNAAPDGIKELTIQDNISFEKKEKQRYMFVNESSQNVTFVEIMETDHGTENESTSISNQVPAGSSEENSLIELYYEYDGTLYHLYTYSAERSIAESDFQKIIEEYILSGNIETLN